MFNKHLILTLLILGFTFQIGFAENIKFQSSSKGKDGKQLTLTGILKKPDGDGPFPAVVLLHGAGGFKDSETRTDLWSKRLVNWGYVTLAVDSMGPRGIEHDLHGNHDELFGLVSVRAFDAYDAKSFLADLALVDSKRIALIGWAHGGMTVLASVIKMSLPRPLKNVEAFKAAISFYPVCDEFLTNTNAPLMILHSGLSDWIVESCTQWMVSKPEKHEVILKIYPEAHSCFDWEGKDEMYWGSRLLYNPEAAKDAIIQVKSFLAKYLK